MGSRRPNVVSWPRASLKTEAAILYGLLSLAAFLTPCAARSDPPPAITTTSAEACAGQRRDAISFELTEALNDVARELSRGGVLNDAIDRIGYPAASSAALYVKSPTNDTAIREIIDDRYCMADSDPPFTEAGFYRRGDEAWIVFAARKQQPADRDSAAIAARVLELVNAARAESRRCGGRQLDAALPLTLSRPLTDAASRHARDMARQNTFDHRGSDGTQPGDRVSRAGYRWRASGENIALGQSNADDLVAAWLESPGHCANIMGPQFTEMGVAFATAKSGNRVTYWAQEFAAPQ